METTHAEASKEEQARKSWLEEDSSSDDELGSSSDEGGGGGDGRLTDEQVRALLRGGGPAAAPAPAPTPAAKGGGGGAQCEVCGRHFASRHAMFRSACRRRCMKKGKDRMEILSKNTTFLLDKISFIKENIDKMIDMLYSEKQQFYATQPPSLTDFDKPPRMVNPSVPIMVKVERPVSSSSEQSSIDDSPLKSDELLNILKGLDGVDEKLVMDELKKDTKEIIPTKKNKKT